MTDSGRRNRPTQSGAQADMRTGGSGIAIRAVGGSTALLGIGGIRLITDPAFDPPGEYRSPSGALLAKTASPAIDVSAIGRVDVVLLSHDQHQDNLDDSGRTFLRTAPLVLTTPSGAARLGGAAHGLASWMSYTVPRPGGGDLTVTAVPARHGPEGCEPVSGEVTGFVLTAPDLPTVYVSGDNASLELVGQIATRFSPVDTAVLFAGAARTGIFDGALLTLSSEETAEAARILRARRAVPVHFNGWRHFTEDTDALTRAFRGAGLADRLVLLHPGHSAQV